MARVTATVVGKVKRSPVKAGSKPRPHGGFPTQAVITLRTMKVAKNFVRVAIIVVSLYMVVSYAIAQLFGIDIFSQWYTVLFEAIIVMYSYSEGKYHCKHIKHLALAILLSDLLTRLDNFYNFLTISEHNWIPIVLLVLGISASIISAIRHFLRVSRTKKQRTQNERNYNERNKEIGN